MSTFYVGKRPVLKGRSEFTDPYKGNKAFVYSWFDLLNPSHVLDGAPDNQHTPGTGYSPHGLQLTRMFLGSSDQVDKNSLVAPGLGTRLDSYYFRQSPMLWKGVTSGNVFPTNFGHKLDPTHEYAIWTNYFFSGVTSAQVLASATLGHKQNAYGAHYAFMGPVHPYEYRGVGTIKSEPMLRTGHGVYAPSVVADAMPKDYGQIPAARATTEHYGFEHVQEWFGVPSAKAL